MNKPTSEICDYLSNYANKINYFEDIFDNFEFMSKNQKNMTLIFMKQFK